MAYREEEQAEGIASAAILYGGSIDDLLLPIQQFPPGEYETWIHSVDEDTFNIALKDVVVVLAKHSVKPAVRITFRVLTDMEKQEKRVSTMIQAYQLWEGKMGTFKVGYLPHFGRLVKKELDKIPHWKVTETIENKMMYLEVEYKSPAKM